MIEQLRMQEVSQVILSMPEGAIIKNKNYQVGEPVMIINNPSLSNLTFLSQPVVAEDGQGHIGTAGITNHIDFVINEGSVLYALWSYIYGYNEDCPPETCIQGNEYITVNKDGYIQLSTKPELQPGIYHFYLYQTKDNNNKLISNTEYEFCVSDDEEPKYFIHYPEAKKGDIFFATYAYKVQPNVISTIKQIHNNIFCSMDIYIKAVDLKNDDKHTIYIHCDKVQIDTNLVLSVNNSSQASFSPIHITSIPEGGELNKDVAKIVVI